jgi:hypothetical protein
LNEDDRRPKERPLIDLSTDSDQVHLRVADARFDLPFAIRIANATHGSATTRQRRVASASAAARSAARSAVMRASSSDGRKH